jgi:ferritin-like metal-binding protein YciE
LRVRLDARRSYYICSSKVEHYEIATYVTIHQFAKKIGLIEVAELLEVTLQEETTDKKLSEVATTAINVDLAEDEV